jgi:alcohol dehydrogenase
VASASAQRALALVVGHLPRAAADPADLIARQAMQEAAFLAGMAIDNCGTGVAHSIGHALGTLHHVPHGVSVAVGLRAALGWNVAGSPESFHDAAAALGCSVDGVPHTLATLFRQTDMQSVVHALPAPAFDLAALADVMAAPENQPMLHNNARAVDDDARAMLAGRTVEVWHELARG